MIGQADRMRHCRRDSVRCCGTGYNLGFGGMTACQRTGWSDIYILTCSLSGNLWHLGLLALWNFCQLCGECCWVVTGSSCSCTGQHSGLWHCRHSRTVPGLDTDLGCCNSHTYCSRDNWTGHLHEWRMLRSSLS